MATQPNDATARKLYDAPTTPTAPAGTTPGERLYPGLVRQHVDRLTTDLWAETGTSEAERAREARFWDDVRTRTGLNDALVMSIAEGSIKNKRAATRVEDDPDGADIALDKQIATWNTESREQLAVTYGPKDAEDLLARTNRFVKQHPKLAERLRERGLGSRPDIVRDLVAHVFSTGWR